MTEIQDLFPVSTRFSPDGRVTIGGMDISTLAEEYGTPLYIYDSFTVYTKYNQLRELLDAHYNGQFQVAYASKAYLSLGFARKLSKTGAAIDVVSLSELEIALSAGFEPEKIHLHGNNKSADEIRLAVSQRIESIVVDSRDEFDFVEAICRDMRASQNIWLRINPDIVVDTHRAVQTGHGASKFGIPSTGGEAGEVIRVVMDSPHVRLTGIHTHLGSQIFDAAQFGKAVTALLELCKSAGYHPGVLGPGGGWGVPYTLSDRENDPAPWVETISRASKDWCRVENKPLPELVIEPGRYLAARAGVALYRVGSTKQVQDDEWIAALDGGMADNPRVSLYGATYQAVLVGDGSGRPAVNTRLVGRFCESGDELIHAISIPRLQRGDLVAIPVSGAYQLSMASNYNLADRPCVLWLDDGNADVLQHREHAATSGWWMGK
jgi:diaminopimelate decarboxylase